MRNLMLRIREVKKNRMKLIKHIGIALLAASFLGSCNEESPESHKIVPGSKNPQKKEIEELPPVQQNQAQQPANGEPDKYGRMPGDAHYGHDHPIQADEQTQNQGQQNQTQQPADGEPDAYGRMPGDAHYGHDHP